MPGNDYQPPVAALQFQGYEASGGYRDWCLKRAKQAPRDYTLRRHSGLLFSIVVPVHKPPARWLQECIDSVRSQFFVDWELILADDASTSATHTVMQHNQTLDSRIKLSLQSLQSGISATTNRAASLAQGDYLVFLDHDDILNAYALSAFAQNLQQTDADILYADEDRFDVDYQRLHPAFKPQFSANKLLCTNYIHHPVVMRRALFETLGGFDSHYDGSQDYELLLRALEHKPVISHIPDVLYHMRLHSGSLASGAAAKPEAHDKGRAAVRAYFQRRQSGALIKPSEFEGCHNISYPLDLRPEISILLLVNDRESVASVEASWRQYPLDEILVCTDSRRHTAARFNNLAYKAIGEVLIFADGALQPEPGCIAELAEQSLRKDIGLVTGKLAYADGKLHSCGLTLGIRGCAGRWHYACNSGDLGFGGWMGIGHEVSAVPWQLMAVKKELFMQAGLFDSQYIKHGFDVHLALQLANDKTLQHLFTPLARANFAVPCPQQAEIWPLEDFKRLWRHWQKTLNRCDPFYSPNLSLCDESITFTSPAELPSRLFGLVMLSGLWLCRGNLGSLTYKAINKFIRFAINGFVSVRQKYISN
ncbi:MAG: hypothetical protein CVV13_10725 [Gammaproteobacteria bacterium HGW-Gammaproteobacteria-3]|nr:MAG: hypothetical protein CVV13_10725 [Gammaproteobacteria bacterium HGW-Gammaproteobacteria-3]